MSEGPPVDPRCGAVQAQLRAGAALDPDAAAHLADCADCARVELDLALAVDECVDEAAVLDGLHARMAAERGPLGWWRSQPTGRRRALGLTVVLGSALAFGLLRPRPDLAVFPMPRMLALVGIYAVVGALASLGALGSRRAPVVRPRLAWAALAVALVVSVGLAALPPAHSAHPASLGGTGAALVPRALACLGVGAGVALPGLLVLGLGARATGHSLRAPWVLGAAAGALAGQLALQLHCPVVASGHRLLGHALLVVILGLATLLLAGRR